MTRAARATALATAWMLIACALGACGLNVQSPDLFLVTRVGQGQRLTLLVNDAGAIRCDGRAAKPLPDRLLLQARDLATALDKDAKANLRISRGSASVFFYTVKLQNGTISFPDTAAAGHRELGQLELFAVQAAQDPCGLSAA